MRSLRLFILLALTLAVGFGANRLAMSYFTTQERAAAEGQLALYRASIQAELTRHAPLVHVLANDTVVINAAAGAPKAPLNHRLKGFAEYAGVEGIYLIGTDGVTVASANFDQPGSFVGQNYEFRPYFTAALAGGQGRFYAIGTTTGRPGYFLSEPVRDAQRTLRGVLVLKISFAELETSWGATREQVFLANEDGVILLASDPGWLYHTLAPLTPAQRAAIARTRQFASEPLRAVDWQPLPDQRARIAGQTRLHLVARDLPHGWSLHYFASDDRALARSWLVTALVAVLAGLGLAIAQVMRARRIGAALRRSEQEEANLRRANDLLAIEISERARAEATLRQTQTDLDRASRLAALGELAASVTHELGQPISAMRNHLAAAEFAPQDPARLISRLSGLADRMEGITRQLKFFATPDAEPHETFDLRAAMRASLGLMRHNFEDRGIDLRLDLPAAPVPVKGSRLRIEQVMTNLLRNALDATQDSLAPRIAVSMGDSGAAVWLTVQDNGHGLGKATLADLAEPFVTTRASGQGMGLGLAISANIVRGHAGEMTAQNAPEGGAIFRVAFPRAAVDDAQSPAQPLAHPPQRDPQGI